MTYRSLLVLLDQDRLCEARTRIALRLARELDAHLVGLAPTGLVNLPVAAVMEAGGSDFTERIWGEFEKLLSARTPSIGLALALDLGIIERLFPELHALVGCVQEPDWHPEGDVWVHTLQVVEQARTRDDDLPRPADERRLCLPGRQHRQQLPAVGWRTRPKRHLVT